MSAGSDHGNRLMLVQADRRPFGVHVAQLGLGLALLAVLAGCVLRIRLPVRPVALPTGFLILGWAFFGALAAAAVALLGLWSPGRAAACCSQGWPAW